MRKRKALIGRTGNKQKQARERLAMKAVPLENAVQPAAVAHVEPQAASLSEDDDFKTFQVVSHVIDALVKQLENDEQKIEHDRLWHDMHKANAIACAEAYKRRSALNPLSNERLCEPFRLAWQQALREWESAYKTDVCSACSKKQTKQCHLARCDC